MLIRKNNIRRRTRRDYKRRKNYNKRKRRPLSVQIRSRINKKAFRNCLDKARSRFYSWEDFQARRDSQGSKRRRERNSSVHRYSTRRVKKVRFDMRRRKHKLTNTEMGRLNLPGNSRRVVFLRSILKRSYSDPRVLIKDGYRVTRLSDDDPDEKPTHQRVRVYKSRPIPRKRRSASPEPGIKFAFSDANKLARESHRLQNNSTIARLPKPEKGIKFIFNNPQQLMDRKLSGDLGDRTGSLLRIDDIQPIPLKGGNTLKSLRDSSLDRVICPSCGYLCLSSNNSTQQYTKFDKPRPLAENVEANRAPLGLELGKLKDCVPMDDLHFSEAPYQLEYSTTQ